MRPGSGSTPTTGWVSTYFATLATKPSWPTQTMMSSAANMNRSRSRRSTSPRRQSGGMAAATTRRASRWAAWRASTSARSRSLLARKNAAWPRVPWRSSSSEYSVRRWTTTTRGARVITSPHRSPTPVAPVAPVPPVPPVRLSQPGAVVRQLARPTRRAWRRVP